MYPTTNDYQTAMGSNSTGHKLRGTVNGVTFEGENVLQNTFVVKNQFCPATKIELGGVYVGEMDLTFTTEYATGLGLRGSWKGKTITAEIGVEIGTDLFEYVPVNGGAYTIQDVTWTNNGLKVVAYDNMSKFDKNINFSTSSGYVYDFISFSCSECGVTLGMTQEEIEVMTNGDAFIGLETGSPVTTYRDVISNIAVVMCSFATINRSGELVFVPIPNTAAITATVPAKLRYSTSFSDYTSFYSMLEVTNQDGTISSYMNNNFGGLSMDIGESPFLQIGTSVYIKTMRQNIIDALEHFRAVPFKVSMLSNPAIDLGDVFKFTGGIGQDSVGVVMSLTHKVNSTTIEGYGENPAVSGVESALEKDIANTAKNSKEQSFNYYTYANMQEITLSEIPKPIVHVLFAVNEETTVSVWHEAKILSELAGDSQEIEYQWFLDGNLMPNNPIDTFGEDGFHTEPHPYWFENVSPGMAHIWEVRAKTNGGTATIDVGDVHAFIMGQKMVAQGTWGGTWEITDEMSTVIFDRAIATLTDSATLSLESPSPDLSVSDTMGVFGAGQVIVTLTDSAVLTLASVMLNLVTEGNNPQNIVTEGATPQNLVTEGE